MSEGGLAPEVHGRSASTRTDANADLALPQRARATISIYGPWVDTYPPGADLEADHLIVLQFQPGTTINGLALVQGTSFSAPYVGASSTNRSRRRVEPTPGSCGPRSSNRRPRRAR